MFRRFILAAVLAAGVSTGALAADALTDGQIAHIAYTAGQLDVSQAGQALIKSQNSDVVDFAILMAKDHKAVNDAALKLITKEEIAPVDNPTSQSLVQGAITEAGKLAQLSGDDFDKGYIANEIAYHKQVIGALQDTLIPATKDAALKEFLTQGVPLFQSHLEHAEKIAAKLNGEENPAASGAAAPAAPPAEASGK